MIDHAVAINEFAGQITSSSFSRFKLRNIKVNASEPFPTEIAYLTPK